MKAKGFGEALLVDANGSEQENNRNVATGPLFGSPAWVALCTHALQEADRLGLEITLNITSGWNLGGPNVKPEQASKLLTWNRTEIRGGTHVEVRLAAPDTKNDSIDQSQCSLIPCWHGAKLSHSQMAPP